MSKLSDNFSIYEMVFKRVIYEVAFSYNNLNVYVVEQLII